MINHQGNQFLQKEYDYVEEVKKRITEHLTPYQRRKTIKDSNLILGALKNHFLFYNLSEQELQNVKEKMLYCDLMEGETIFNEGEIGHCFFIINKGKVDIEVEGVFKKQLSTQNGFGELALLYNTGRTSTAKAKKDVGLWLIDRQSFRESVDEIATMEFQQNRKCLQSVSFFTNLTHQQKDLITSALTIQKYSKGQIIVQEGDPGSSLFIIKEGNATIEKNGKQIKKVTVGDSFGEQSLYYNTIRLMTVKADDDVVCLVLGRDNLSRVFNDQVHNITFRNFIKTAFQKSAILSKLTKDQMDRIIEIMHINSYKAGDHIFKRGMTNNKLVVIFQGNLCRSRSGIVVARKGQTYGQHFLSSTNKNRTMDDELVIQSDGVIAELSFDNLGLCLCGYSLQQVIARNQQEIQRKMAHQQNQLARISKDVQLKELIYHQKIYQNQFGPVLRVSSTTLQTNYVLKIYSKKKIYQEQIQKLIATSRKILNKVGHPFIVKLAKTYVDAQNFYFLYEYVRGLEFLEVVKELGLLSTNDSRFYIASIILILQYLHHHNIVHRDIKMESFIVTEQGYLKLIDMLTCKLLKSKTTRTSTVLGTPHYMAPQIMIGKGYTTFVDLWAVGVLLFELMCGFMPFGDDTQSPFEIYEQILKDSLKFPQMLKDKKAKKLMEQLLSRTPESRLGGSYSSLMNHPWLQNFQWSLMIQQSKQLAPPFIPKLKLRSQEQFKSSLGLLDIVKGTIDERLESWPQTDPE